jgi:hydroxyacylglutathione hydrolase
MLNIKSFEFNPFQENTYILYNEFNECIIIDPGCYFDAEKDEMVAFINEQKIKPTLLLNTHCHLDHIFGNKFISEKYDLDLHIHEMEKPVLDFAPASGLMYSVPFDNYSGKINYLTPGEPIKFGADELDVLFTPGHSPGSVSFYSRKNNFVVSGDALFKNSVGRSDLPGGNHDVLIKSIKEKLLTLPDDTLVYSGHGPVTTVGDERRDNGFLR